MAESREFKPKKEFGAISSSDEAEIRFYVDEYKGYSYASIRTFLKLPGYSGPTKAGVTMNAALLGKVISELEKLPAEPQDLQDRELARFPKKAGLELVARVVLYHDATGIDLREWIDDGTYKGWSKKGTRIPYGALSQSVKYMKEMRTYLSELPPPSKK